MNRFEVINVFVEEMEKAGCTNGNYPEVEIEVLDSTKLSGRSYYYGKTCRCHNGCSNTWRIKYVDLNNGDDISIKEMSFIDEEDLLYFLNS